MYLNCYGGATLPLLLAYVRMHVLTFELFTIQPSYMNLAITHVHMLYILTNEASLHIRQSYILTQTQVPALNSPLYSSISTYMVQPPPLFPVLASLLGLKKVSYMEINVLGAEAENKPLSLSDLN